MDAKALQTSLNLNSASYHLLRSEEWGQDVDSQLALFGVAFTLTLDLLNNTLATGTSRTKGIEP